MPRSSRTSEPSFGSDSFLDVVANVVGILIILMVVVGIKAAKAPPPTVASVEVIQPEPLPPPALPAAGVVAPYQSIDFATAEPPAFAPPPLPDVAPRPELIAQAESETQSIAQRQEQLKQFESQLSGLHTQVESQNIELEVLRLKLATSEEELAARRNRSAILDQSADRRRQEIQQLQASVDQLREKQPPVQTLEHVLTPVGREVQGEEIHFRLAGNRVSVLPITLLVEEVRMDMDRHKEILANRSFFRGSSRPVQGYTMEYLLQREPVSASDAMRLGPGVIRIGVAGWIITPTGGIVEESLQEALQPGSRFRLALERRAASATATFWVYPDSFDLHRDLTKIVRESGYAVASRPLPDGVPIAGSPQGSKSLAQ